MTVLLVRNDDDDDDDYHDDHIRCHDTTQEFMFAAQRTESGSRPPRKYRFKFCVS